MVRETTEANCGHLYMSLQVEHFSQLSEMSEISVSSMRRGKRSSSLSYDEAYLATSLVMRHVNQRDMANMACVSRTWRDVVYTGTTTVYVSSINVDWIGCFSNLKHLTLNIVCPKACLLALQMAPVSLRTLELRVYHAGLNLDRFKGLENLKIRWASYIEHKSTQKPGFQARRALRHPRCYLLPSEEADSADSADASALFFGHVMVTN
jgi:hypothetical protein